MAEKIRGIKRILQKDLVPFTKQMASMNGAGMSILTVMQTLEEQAENPEFKKVLKTLLRTIEGGDPLSKGLAKFPKIFDDMFVNMTVAGEQSGQFATIMKRLADILQNSSRLKRKVKSAMTYPTVIMSIALLLCWGLIQFVVPTFAEMFAGSGKPLPALTQSLVDLADFIKNWNDLNAEDFAMLSAAGYRNASYVKQYQTDMLRSAVHYFMHIRLPEQEIESIIRGILEDSECGHIYRIKGSLPAADGTWLTINAEKNRISIAPAANGQAVLIVIGEELNREAIDTHLKAHNSDPEYVSI